MSEAREEAERRWPKGWDVEEGTWRDGAVNGFVLGSEWAEQGHPQPTEGEPTDVQVLAALNAHYRLRLAQSEAMLGDPEADGDARSLEEYSSKSVDRMRAALRAATRVADQGGER